MSMLISDFGNSIYQYGSSGFNDRETTLTKAEQDEVFKNVVSKSLNELCDYTDSAGDQSIDDDMADFLKEFTFNTIESNTLQGNRRAFAYNAINCFFSKASAECNLRSVAPVAEVYEPAPAQKASFFLDDARSAHRFFDFLNLDKFQSKGKQGWFQIYANRALLQSFKFLEEDLSFDPGFSNFKEKYGEMVQLSEQIHSSQCPASLAQIGTNIFNKAQSLKAGEDFFVPIGQNYHGGGGHATVLKVLRQNNGLFAVYHYNSGAGINNHQCTQIGRKLKYSPNYPCKDVHPNALTEQFFTNLLNITNGNIKLTNPNSIYGVINSLGGRTNVKVNSSRFISQQERDSCTLSGSLAVAHDHMNPLTYKLFKAKAKANSIIEYHKKFKGNLNHLLKKKLSLAIDELYKSVSKYQARGLYNSLPNGLPYDDSIAKQIEEIRCAIQ